MLWNVRHMGRVAILLLYAIYALTPIHLCAMEGDSNGGAPASLRASTPQLTSSG